MSQSAALRSVQQPAAGTYTLDPAHTVASFTVRHLMISKVRGWFRDVEGTITIGDTPETSSVRASIPAATISTGVEQRDEHLRGPDFLDAERYPALTFVSTAVERTGESTLAVHGDLTIRDVTRPVVLDVVYEGGTVDPWGNPRVGFSASTQIDREQWGITWNQALEAGGVLVGKTVRIELEVSAVRA